MRTKASFWAQLGQETFEGPDQLVRQVREAMLSALDQCGVQPADTRLRRDVANAQDLSDLWYLRPRLLQEVGQSSHRAEAQATLGRITELFQGHFVTAISSRFGAL